MRTVCLGSNATNAALAAKGISLSRRMICDVLREPRLIDADKHHRGMSVEDVVLGIVNEGRAIVLACGTPCGFLNSDNHCSIYPTRPNCCVGMQAGDEQCQQAREAVGLSPLEPLP